jgi:hypothetical protein
MHKARLRLAATGQAAPATTSGVTRTHMRMENGRIQQVHQYQNHRPSHGHPTAPAAPAKDGKYKNMPTKELDWRDLDPGDIVDFGGEPWKVLHTYVTEPKEQGGKTKSRVKGKAGKANGKGTSSGKKGASSGKPTSSKGKGVNTGKKAGAGTMSKTPVADILENLWTGKRVQITLHPGFKVWVYE